ncbi:hypothetical protein [Streptomyces sp. MS2.AVA.5]|uniref:Uncharacterized protein n=1 Tax=Streptomyces achmelvichensis TaxID=3134111 RepID=A0ACC6PMN2_9ACTN
MGPLGQSTSVRISTPTASAAIVHVALYAVTPVPASADETLAEPDGYTTVCGWPVADAVTGHGPLEQSTGPIDGVVPAFACAGNNIPDDSPAMDTPGPKVVAQLRTQGQGGKTVARMRELGQAEVSINTTGFPELDGAPGGLFPELLGGAFNFGVANMLANLLNNAAAQPAHNAATFVPAISAVVVADIDNHDALYSKINSDYSDLYVRCATTNEGHTVMTRELGEWIVTRLKDA